MFTGTIETFPVHTHRILRRIHTFAFVPGAQTARKSRVARGDGSFLHAIYVHQILASARYARNAVYRFVLHLCQCELVGDFMLLY
jgi:hypothetical protein